MKDYDSQHALRHSWDDFDSQHALLNAFPWAQSSVETTVPSMQRPRPLSLAPRWTLFRRELLDTRGRFLESQPDLWGMNMRQFRLAEPVQIKPRRDSLWPAARCAQAAFQAAPKGSSWGLSAFEPRWRAGTLPSARLGPGPAIPMAPTTSGPGAGGSRDILWHVSEALGGSRS